VSTRDRYVPAATNESSKIAVNTFGNCSLQFVSFIFLLPPLFLSSLPYFFLVPFSSSTFVSLFPSSILSLLFSYSLHSFLILLLQLFLLTSYFRSAHTFPLHHRHKCFRLVPYRQQLQCCGTQLFLPSDLKTSHSGWKGVEGGGGARRSSIVSSNKAPIA
jgi:hypothetical protein